MLDVHAPHQTAHSWRDFFIHIATISVGLLIAIGLEQSVEGIHHHHERQELIADMRNQARQNLKAAQHAFDVYSASATWLRQSIDVAGRAASSNGGFDITLPAAAHLSGVSATLLPAWSVAKNNGKADLDLTALGLRLGAAIEPGARLRLTAADHDTLMQSLAFELASYLEVIHWNAIWAGACDAIANDAASVEAMTSYLEQHSAAVPSQFR
jgi:hypothetical protein